MSWTGSKHARRAAALVAACVALGAAGCGEKTLDSAEAEEEIADKLEAQGLPRPEKVDCPDDMEAKKGETYTCTLTAEGGDTVDGTLTTTNDDGNFEFEVKE